MTEAENNIQNNLDILDDINYSHCINHSCFSIDCFNDGSIKVTYNSWITSFDNLKDLIA